jgi:hypothetical protein
MSSLATSTIVFVCVIAAALLGVFVSPRLPVHHTSPESKDVVRLGMGLVATMVAVVLGLLVSSAKSFYDTQNNEVTQLAANFILLDRILAHYGPETRDLRAGLRAGLAHFLESEGLLQDLKTGAIANESILSKISELTPKDDNQRTLKAQATSLAFQLGQTRWLIFEQNAVPLPALLLIMLIGWLIVLFTSFGIFAPRNITVLTGLILAALAASGAILLILEMYRPQVGLIRVSDAPLRAALAQLGQ